MIISQRQGIFAPAKGFCRERCYHTKRWCFTSLRDARSASIVHRRCSFRQGIFVPPRENHFKNTKRYYFRHTKRYSFRHAKRYSFHHAKGCSLRQEMFVPPHRGKFCHVKIYSIPEANVKTKLKKWNNKNQATFEMKNNNKWKRQNLEISESSISLVTVVIVDLVVEIISSVVIPR